MLRFTFVKFVFISLLALPAAANDLLCAEDTDCTIVSVNCTATPVIKKEKTNDLFPHRLCDNYVPVGFGMMSKCIQGQCAIVYDKSKNSAADE